MGEFKRRTTQQGLGASKASRADVPRVTVKLPVEGRRARTTLPVPGTEGDAPLDAPRIDVPRIDGPRIDTPPPVSGPRSRSERRSRDAIAVDDVGDRAVEMTSRPPLAARPKVVKTRRELADAPLDPREAFLLSLIDGKLNVTSLVDVSGMPDTEVLGILSRLRRLGIVVYS